MTIRPGIHLSISTGIHENFLLVLARKSDDDKIRPGIQGKAVAGEFIFRYFDSNGCFNFQK
jgi:hypothetical protein